MTSPPLARIQSAPGKVTSKQRINPINYARIPLGGPPSVERQFVKTMALAIGGDTAIIPLGRGRAGLHLLARYALEASGRRKVLMSPYTIPDVVNMVVLAGGEPVFFDHEPNSTRCDLDHLASLLDTQTACVFITHYHVNEDRMQTLAELCRARGAYLFDDCALAYGGRVGDTPVGALSDASVFSFSSFKLINFFWGGMVTSRNAKIADWLRNIVGKWPRLKLKDYANQAKICISYDVATRPAIFRLVVFPMLLRQAAATSDAHTLDHVRIESMTFDSSLASRPHASAFVEWSSKLGSVGQWLERRREIARIYHAQLAEHAVSGPLTDADFDQGCFVNYPVMTHSQSRDRVCLQMMRDGFDLGRSLYPNVQRLEAFSSFGGKSENVDLLAASALYLPTHYGVSNAYAEEIASALATQLAR